MAQSADDLKRHYRSLTDNELLGIAAAGELTRVADTALRGELAYRRLGDSDIANYGKVLAAAKAADPEMTAERSPRMLERLKLYACIVAIVSTLVFVYGLGRFLGGHKDNGTAMMILAFILSAAGGTKLWLERKFWSLLLR